MAPATRKSSLRSLPTPAQASSSSSSTSSNALTSTTTTAVKREIEEEKKALAAITPREDVNAAILPASLRFPLLVLTSLVVSAMGYSGLSALGEYKNGTFGGDGELASVSRKLGEWWEVGALISWKGFELGLGWFGEYDGYDIAALGLLARGPSLYLLSNFYAISTTTILSSLFVDFLSTYIPFRLLRPLTPAHSSKSNVRVPNAEIASDKYIQALTTVLPAIIYSVTIFTAYKTFLPQVLATSFEGIRSLAVVYRGDFVALVPIMLGFGAAIREFVFVPAVVVAPTPQDVLNASFAPATATLSETIYYNFWGYSTRTKTVIKRTATLMFVSGMHTFVQTSVTLEGVEAKGAAVYAGVWVVAAALAGGVMGLVGAV